MTEPHDPRRWEQIHGSPERLAEVLVILMETGVISRAEVEELFAGLDGTDGTLARTREAPTGPRAS
jgi:hypothetical protein